MGYCVMIALCLHNGYRVVIIYIENVIGIFGLLTEHKDTLKVNFSVCNLGFYRDVVKWLFEDDSGRNILQIDIFFCHLLLVHYRIFTHCWKESDILV